MLIWKEVIHTEMNIVRNHVFTSAPNGTAFDLPSLWNAASLKVLPRSHLFKCHCNSVPKSRKTSDSQQPSQRHQMETQGINKYIYTTAGEFKIPFQTQPIKIRKLTGLPTQSKNKNTSSVSLF